MRRLVLATVVALGAGTPLAYAQEADLRGAESHLALPVLAVLPGEAFVVKQERLAWAEERLPLGELSGGASEWVTLAGQPTTARGGGNRFGGPLVWALAITAATTIGVFVLGRSLAAEETVAPADTQAIAVSESPRAFRTPPASVLTFGW